MPLQNIGRKAGKDRAGTQCTEKHQWTQGWLRSCQDARLAKIMPGRKARFAGKEPRLGTGYEIRVTRSGSSEPGFEERDPV